MQRAGHGVGGQGPHRDGREGLSEEPGPITGLREAQEGLKQESFVAGLVPEEEHGAEMRRGSRQAASAFIQVRGSSEGNGPVVGVMDSRDVQGVDREIVTADAGGGMEAAEHCGNGRDRQMWPRRQTGWELSEVPGHCFGKEGGRGGTLRPSQRQCKQPET